MEITFTTKTLGSNILTHEDKDIVIDFEMAVIYERDAPVLEGEREAVERACAYVRLFRDNSHFLARAGRVLRVVI